MIKEQRKSELVIVSSPVGLVIGNLYNLGEKGLILNTPRVIQIIPTKTGIQISFLPLLGAPSTVVLPSTCWWTVEDRALKAHYLEEITGLTLVTGARTN